MVTLKFLSDYVVCQVSLGQDGLISTHSSFDESFTLPPGSSLNSSSNSVMTPLFAGTAVAEFIPSLNPLPQLTSPLQADLASSIAANLTGEAGLTNMGHGLPFIERSISRNSYSPALSDSGISMDAVGNGSAANQSVFNIGALAKFGQFGVNAQGIYFRFYFSCNFVNEIIYS